MAEADNNKRIAKNTAFLYIRMLLVLFVSLFTTRVVLRSLGVVDYGINNVVGGFVSMFAFLNTSMSNGIQRFYNYSLGKDKGGTITDVYNTALRIQFLLAIVLFVLLETVGTWYMHNKMVVPAERFTAAMWVFQMSVCSMMFVVLQVPYSAAIIAHERMDYFAYVSIFDVVAKLVIAYSLYAAKFDRLILYSGLQLLVTVILFLMYYLYSKHHFKDLRFSWTFHKDLFKRMFTFSGWSLFGTFSYVLKGQGLNMLLNVFFGPVVNAARGVSYMISNAIQGFQSNIVIAFSPQLVQAYAAGNQKRVLTLFYSLSKISFVLLSMLSIPVIIELDYILRLWLGDAVPEYTESFTVLILLNLIISSLNTPLVQVVNATGKMKNFHITTSLIVCSILPISWVVLKFTNNANSAYIVSLIMTIINQVACCIVLKKIYAYSIRDYLKMVILPLVLFVLISPILPLVLQNCIEQSFLRVVIIGIISIISSVLSTYFIVLDKEEKSFVRRYVIGKLKK